MDPNLEVKAVSLEIPELNFAASYDVQPNGRPFFSTRLQSNQSSRNLSLNKGFDQFEK
jgi:hypothetical protein